MTTDALPMPIGFPRPKKKWFLGAMLGLVMYFATLVSNPFDIQVGTDVPAFPGAEGFGVETQHGRDGVVCMVTNVNDNGSGSLRNCLLMTVPRIIIFKVSGTIILDSAIELGSAHSNFAILGQTAPGDGIAIRGSSSMTQSLLRLGNFSASDPAGGVSNALVRYIKFRHGSQLASSSAAHDNVQIFSGSNHIVFDHNSLTWCGDEQWSIWVGTGSGAGGGDSIHDVTFSRNLWGECAETAHNLGPLISGGNSVGKSIYNISFHHNLGVHTSHRHYKIDTGSGNSSRGAIFINNIHYNTYSSEYSFGQNQYSGCSATVVDIISDYFKAGPDTGSGGEWPVTMSRGASHVPPSGCADHIPISLHFVTSILRDINGNDTLAKSDDANPYNMVSEQFGTETWSIRASEITDQPEYPITRSTAAAAYTDVVINENVGANKPAFDSVDQRMVDAPEDGDDYSTVNLPGTRGSATWPTLSTSGVPTDTDNDGVPDDFETGTLGTDPNVFEEQAQLDHDGDGYKNIEEWANSL